MDASSLSRSVFAFWTPCYGSTASCCQNRAVPLEALHPSLKTFVFPMLRPQGQTARRGSATSLGRSAGFSGKEHAMSYLQVRQQCRLVLHFRSLCWSCHAGAISSFRRSLTSKPNSSQTGASQTQAGILQVLMLTCQQGQLEDRVQCSRGHETPGVMASGQ